MAREEEVKAAISYLKSYRKLDEATLKIAPLNSVARFTANKGLKYWDMAIEALKQEPKTGHWIVDGSVDCYLDKVRCHCSECGKKKIFPADYNHIKDELFISYKYPDLIDSHCPKCGAKMIKPQERSDKE